jgi:hypothetical protein
VHVLDERTLAIPDYDGNGMYRTWGNVLVNPRVGLLFLDFESPKRLRINGTAQVREDDPLQAGCPGPCSSCGSPRDDLSELPALPSQDEAARALGVRAAPRLHAADSGVEDVREFRDALPARDTKGEP